MLRDGVVCGLVDGLVGQANCGECTSVVVYWSLVGKLDRDVMFRRGWVPVLVGLVGELFVGLVHTGAGVGCQCIITVLLGKIIVGGLMGDNGRPGDGVDDCIDGWTGGWVDIGDRLMGDPRDRLVDVLLTARWVG